MLYGQILKPLLFRMEPEKAHRLTIDLARIGFHLPLISNLLRHQWSLRDERLATQRMGLHFPNPVGLGAGFDKDGRYLDIMSRLGFGFIEVGTVTPRPQQGNPTPRLFRLPADEALINRMGFNNEGVEKLAERLERLGQRDFVLGGNIGKNKDTPNEAATADYVICLQRLAGLVDYFVINVSSPNTPGLRALQDKEPLRRLLLTLQDHNHKSASPRPLLLKIAPDLDPAQIDDIVEITTESVLEGIIATNTTVQRPAHLKTPESKLKEIGAGGLSGAPVFAPSNEVLKQLRDKLPPGKTIIGVGGIVSPGDALEKLRLGADLIQIYSGLIYRGPAFVRQILEAI